MSVILEHLTKEQGFTLAEAKEALRQWQIIPIEQGDKQVGEIMIQQNEVHFALEKGSRLKLGRRKLMKDALDNLLASRDFLVTKLYKGDKFKSLIEFMGFRKTHEAAGVEYFWLDKETRNDRA